jgi:hypothetical protein
MIFQSGEGRLTAVSYSVCTGEGGGLFYVKDDALIYQTRLFHQETMNLQPLIMQITMVKQYMECTSSPLANFQGEVLFPHVAQIYRALRPRG